MIKCIKKPSHALPHPVYSIIPVVPYLGDKVPLAVHLAGCHSVSVLECECVVCLMDASLVCLCESAC